MNAGHSGVMAKASKTSKKVSKASEASKGAKNKHANATSFNSETAKAAQLKSRESRKRNTSLRKWAEFYGKQHIAMPMPDGGKEETTWDGAVIVGLYRRAMSGDTNAAKYLAELSGQNPEQTLNINANVKTKREPDMTPEEAARFVAELNKHI